MGTPTLSHAEIADVLAGLASDFEAALVPQLRRSTARALHAAAFYTTEVSIALQLLEAFGGAAQICDRLAATGHIMLAGLPPGRDRTSADHAAFSAARLAIVAAEAAARHAAKPTGSTLPASTYVQTRAVVGRHLENLTGVLAVRR